MESDPFNHWLSDPARAPLIMGVLNLTPDSFSDGGRFVATEAAVEHARHMIEAGADLIDVGGESTRPGSQPVPPQEQIVRILPTIRAIRARWPIMISVDTTRAAVAQAALDAGANLVNDVSAGRDDEQMFPLLAARPVPLVLMHSLGPPATMQNNPTYADVTAEVADFLRRRLSAAVAAGISETRILLDPGLGFGKTTAHNLTLLARLSELAGLGRPLVVGPSRKAFIGQLTGEAVPARRVFGTAAAVAWCAQNGAAILRVHDVEPMAQVLRVVAAIRQAART